MSIEAATTALNAGGVVLTPTDTVYGIAVLARYRGARQRLFQMKGRPGGVPIALLVSGIDQAKLLGHFDERSEKVAAALWPGALTLVVPATDLAIEGGLAADDNTIGLRCPANETVIEMAAAAGPLAVTSANRHGETTAATAADSAASLVHQPHVIIDGGRCSGSPSTVARVTDDVTIFRDGSVSMYEIESALSR